LTNINNEIFTANRLTAIPAMKALVIIFAGIALGFYFDLGSQALKIVIAVVFITSVALVKLNYRKVAYILIFAVCGFYIATEARSNLFNTTSKIIIPIETTFRGEVQNIIRRDSASAIVRLNASLNSETLGNLENTGLILRIANINDFKIVPGDSIGGVTRIRTPHPRLLANDFNEAQYAANQEALLLAYSKASEIYRIDSYWNADILLFKLRASFQNRIESVFPESVSGIVIALLTGDKTRIAAADRDNFIISGVAHVLCVSGLHVGVVAAVVYMLLGFVANRKLKFVVFIIMLAAYIAITGFQASAVRAGIMSAFFALAHVRERRANLLNILALTTMLLLIIHPPYLLSVGFQMSFGAVFGIGLFYPLLNQRLTVAFKPQNQLASYFINSTSLTVAASVIISPLTAYYFGYFSVISPLANLLVIPLMIFSMLDSLLATIFSYISIGFASFFALPSIVAVELAKSICETAAALPFSSIKSDNIVFLSLMLSSAILYVSLSKKIRIAAFRLALSVVIIASILFIINYTTDEIQILPRRSFVAVNIPLNDTTLLAVALDRMPSLYPVADLAYEEMLQNDDRNLLFGYSGNNGIFLADRLKKVRNIKTIEINHEAQRLLQRMLNKDEAIVRIIDLK